MIEYITNIDYAVKNYSNRFQDFYGEPVKIGSQVRIMCQDDESFSRKLGTVILINRVMGLIFVQMKESKGGIWWLPRYVINRLTLYQRLTRFTKANLNVIL